MSGGLDPLTFHCAPSSVFILELFNHTGREGAGGSGRGGGGVEGEGGWRRKREILEGLNGINSPSV